MDRSFTTLEECPLNFQGCPVIDEVRRLGEACKRLQELTQTDTLTGLFNLRYLLKALEGEMERTRRTGLATAFIMIDLDHFKRINDTYGHESGNKALQWSGNILRQNIRRIDIPCRYGGEEFAIVLPATRLTQAVLTAERLRSALINTQVELNGEKVKITASFGVDAYRGREDLSVQSFIRMADRFLLEAKATGRNRVCYDRSRAGVVATEVTDKEREALLRAHGSGEQAE